MREKILFNDGWKFHCGDLPARNTVMKGPDYMGAKTVSERRRPRVVLLQRQFRFVELDNTSPDLWLDVNLPHDYIIEQTPSKRNRRRSDILNMKTRGTESIFRLMRPTKTSA